MYRLPNGDYSLADIERFTELSIKKGIPLESLVRDDPGDLRVVVGAALLGVPREALEMSVLFDAFARFLAGPGAWLGTKPEALFSAALQEGLLEEGSNGWRSLLDPLPGVSAARLADELEAAQEILKLRRARMREALQAKNRLINRAPEPEFSREIDERFMREAIEEAEKALASGEIPVGAVVTAGGEIVSRAGNETLRRSDPTAHAEVVALRAAAAAAANHRLTDTTLYVTLEPCPMCAGAIAEARCARVVYGAPDVKRGALEGALRLFDIPGVNHRPSISGGVLEDECRALLRDFFFQRRKEERDAAAGSDRN